MSLAIRIAAGIVALLLLIIVGFNIWGANTLGTITPQPDAARDAAANRVVMVFGATGSAGDGLLKAAIEDPEVERIVVVTRRSSPRIDAAVADGRVEMRLHEDYTDYASLADVLGEVNTVLWGLGTSSLNVDDATYTRIHVDFPMAFLRAWLAARTEGPMAFHFITGMGTGAEEDAYWAREKARTESEMAALAEGTGLRTFSYRSAWIRPTSENSNAAVYLLEHLLKPGKLVIAGRDLGGAMLEISARTGELPNGTLIDAADSIAYGEAYRAYRERG
jgi:hypothetical protein